MAKLVLFDGGDGGGLIIKDDGVRPIPPFHPFVRAQIKAVLQLVGAIQDQRSGTSSYDELNALTNRLSNLAIQQVEAIIGTLDAEASLIVTNGEEDGFVCGTTGRMPVLLPAHPKELPALSSTLEHVVTDRSLLMLVEKAAEQGRVGDDLFERPAEIARELGVELSERGARGLQLLAPSRVRELEDPPAREIVTFFQRVLADGRYIDTWAIQPAAVSEALDVQLSDDAVERIIVVGASLPRQISSPFTPIVIVGVVIREDAVFTAALVATQVMVFPLDIPMNDIIDRSDKPKF